MRLFARQTLMLALRLEVDFGEGRDPSVVKLRGARANRLQRARTAAHDRIADR